MVFFLNSVVGEKRCTIFYGLQQRTTAWTKFCSVSCKKYVFKQQIQVRTELEQTKHFWFYGGERKNTDNHEQKARDMKFDGAKF